MAKKARTNPSINKIVNMEIEDALDNLERHSKLKWTKTIVNKLTNKPYDKLFPTGRLHIPKIIPRAKDTTLTRLRFHNCALNSYLHKFHLHPTGLCNLCQVEETVGLPHFLLHCHGHTELHDELLHVCNDLCLIFL